MSSIHIEAALTADHPAIEHLLDLTFGLSRWTKTSYRLREGNVAIEGLSLVTREAETRDGAIQMRESADRSRRRKRRGLCRVQFMAALYHEGGPA